MPQRRRRSKGRAVDPVEADENGREVGGGSLELGSGIAPGSGVAPGSGREEESLVRRERGRAERVSREAEGGSWIVR